MILNSAVIERYLIDGKTFEDTKEFIDALLACDDLVADVYVNYQRVASGPLSLSVNNSWIIANVDERMSITNMDGNAYVINIVVHQLGRDELEDIIMRSTSPLSTFIDPGDIDADLYFAVMATVPECTQECHVPESEFNMMGTNNIVPKDFTDKNQCPDDPTIPEPEPGVIKAYYSIKDDLFRFTVIDVLGNIMTCNPEYYHEWTIGVGDGKGDSKFISISDIENMSELTIEVNRNTEPYINNQDAQDAFNALLAGADGMIMDINEYDEGHQNIKTLVSEVALIPEN